MHKFRTILSVVATAAMVLGTMGVASAAGTSNETRADFIVQLDQSLGIQPVTPSTPDFSDVPSTNADYGYIEAAYQKGFINGIAKGLFGPTLPITRAEAAKILVEAYEGGNYTPTQTSTTFTDNASIPTALVGYVAEANSLKLMLGFTSGSFGPEAYLTTAQETHLVAQLQAVQAAAGFKVTASSTDVAVGQIVTLSSTGAGTTTYAVTGANASSALISGTSFVASAAGNYVVTGTNSGNTASVTIGVYGAATGLKISAPTSVVANGASQTNVTVSVVDASGNVVANNTDEIKLVSGNTFAGEVGTSATTVSTNPAEELAVNGVATFVLQSGTVPGASTTLTATDQTTGTSVVNPTGTSYTAAVADTAQTAASLGVTAPQYLSVNAGNEPATMDVQVLDQSGEPMLYGTYPFSVSISGPAEFTDGTTTAHSYAYTGNGQAGSNAGAQAVTIDGLQGQTGAITVSVTGTNLKAATATVTAVISGSASAIQLTAPSTTSFAEGTDSGAYSISYVDSHGYPLSGVSENLLVVVKNGTNVVDATGGNIQVLTSANGTTYAANASGETVGTSGVTLSGTALANALANGIELADTGTANYNSADAGTYTIQVSDAGTDGLTASSTETLTETNNSAAALSVTGAAYISAANPTDTISAQIIDAYGNPVAAAGVPVAFSSAATTTSMYSAPTLSANTVNTNANGVATVTATVPAYVNQSTNPQYTVSATATYDLTSLNPVGYTGNVQGFSVESTVATGVTVSLKDVQSGSTYDNSNGIATAGDEVQATVYAVDQYGNPVTSNDSVTLAFSGTGSIADNGTNGQALSTTSPTAATSDTVTLNGINGAVVDLWALGSGPATIKASDNSAPGSVSGSAALTVEPGQVSAFGLNTSGGSSASTGVSVTANTPVTLTLQGTDAYGNASYLSASGVVGYAVYVASNDATGAFRLASTGGNVSTVLVPAGSSGVTVYYVDSASGTPDLTAPDYVAYNTTSSALTLTASSGFTGGTYTVTGSTGLSIATVSNGSYTYTGSGTATITYVEGGTTVSFQINL